jgi:hypothetical protein
MKPTLFNWLCVALFFAAGLTLAQTRTDAFDATGVNVERFTCEALPDAGWECRGCGRADSEDGGTTVRECSAWFQLGAVGNRGRADGLAAAAAPRLQRALRFDVDAGAP